MNAKEEQIIVEKLQREAKKIAKVYDELMRATKENHGGAVGDIINELLATFGGKKKLFARVTVKKQLETVDRLTSQLENSLLNLTINKKQLELLKNRAEETVKILEMLMKDGQRLIESNSKFDTLTFAMVDLGQSKQQALSCLGQIHNISTFDDNLIVGVVSRMFCCNKNMRQLVLK